MSVCSTSKEVYVILCLKTQNVWCMLVCRVGAGVSMHCVSFESLCVMQQIAEGGGEWVLPAH